MRVTCRSNQENTILPATFFICVVTRKSSPWAKPDECSRKSDLPLGNAAIGVDWPSSF